MLSIQDATASTDSVWDYGLRNKAVLLKYLYWCKANSSVCNTVSYGHNYWVPEQKSPFAHVSEKHRKNTPLWNAHGICVILIIITIIIVRVNLGIPASS